MVRSGPTTPTSPFPSGRHPFQERLSPRSLHSTDSVRMYHFLVKTGLPPEEKMGGANLLRVYRSRHRRIGCQLQSVGGVKHTMHDGLRCVSHDPPCKGFLPKNPGQC